MTSYPPVTIILIIMMIIIIIIIIKFMPNEEMDRDISHTLQFQVFVKDSM
jgi:hypothetical protein